jgi:putative exosortase-associated protein (TIGR04073 family)
MPSGIKKEVRKMKKLLASVIAIAFVLVCKAPLYAIPEPIDKLTKGVKDIISAPLELPKYAHKEVKDSTFKPKGLLMGLLKGTAHAIKKIGYGAVDVVTFPVKFE